MMTSDAIAQVRASLPGPEAAALVRDIIRASVEDQATLWERIDTAVSALKRRGEVNHFSEGIRTLAMRERD